MTQKPTPEEKLFAVIQGAQQASPRARAHAVSLASVRAQLYAFVRQVDLPGINRTLACFIAGLAAWCLLNPWLFRPRLDRVLQHATQYLAPFVIAPPLDGLKASADYIARMRSQDPFRVGETAARPSVSSLGTSPSPNALPAPTVQALLSDFKLVGIAKGVVPHAMIEQVSQRMTHVLKAGDPIGLFTVKDVLEDRVILQYGTEELELF